MRFYAILGRVGLEARISRDDHGMAQPRVPFLVLIVGYGYLWRVDCWLVLTCLVGGLPVLIVTATHSLPLPPCIFERAK